MNYFELFELEVSFIIDKVALKQKYYALSRAFHPDNFTLSNADAQSEALTKTTMLNEGFKILNDKQKRIKYVLELAGVSFEEGKETVPQDFLMEMMDINEEIMEFQMDPEKEVLNQLLDKLYGLEELLDKTIDDKLVNFNLENVNYEHLSKIKEYYLKSKYLVRVKNNLSV